MAPKTAPSVASAHRARIVNLLRGRGGTARWGCGPTGASWAAPPAPPRTASAARRLVTVAARPATRWVNDGTGAGRTRPRAVAKSRGCRPRAGAGCATTDTGTDDFARTPARRSTTDVGLLVVLCPGAARTTVGAACTVSACTVSAVDGAGGSATGGTGSGTAATTGAGSGAGAGAGSAAGAGSVAGAGGAAAAAGTATDGGPAAGTLVAGAGARTGSSDDGST